VTEEAIAEVGIDAKGRLFVRPSSTSFDYIYRAAMGVNWDPGLGRLYGPKPKELDQLQWFERIVGAAAAEYDIHLTLGPQVNWSNVPDQLRRAISAKAR